MTLSGFFGAELVEILNGRSRLLRYTICLLRTIRVLQRERPETLFVSSPSVVLAGFSVSVGRLWASRIIIDAHNAGISPFEGKSRFLNATCRLILQHADVVLVTNPDLQRYLGMDHVEVLPDPLPFDPGAVPAPVVREVNDPARDFLVTYITTWSSDDPYEHVIAAARLLPAEIVIAATGRCPEKLRTVVPRNFEILGFLAEIDYVKQLAASDVILVLTERDACLTCGAYEAIGLEVPPILSRTSALMAYFGEGASYVGNDATDISKTILKVRSEYTQCRCNVIKRRDELQEEWKKTFSRVKLRVLGKDGLMDSP